MASMNDSLTMGALLVRAEKAEDTLRRVQSLLAEYEKDDREHLNTFGQHHPYAGWAADHLREALTGEA